MKQNFKQTIYQRTDDDLHRIAKDYHFYSAAERQIATDELERRNNMQTDFQKTIAQKTDEELMSIAKDMDSYSVEERLVAIAEQQARKKMAMSESSEKEKKKNDLKPIHYLLIAVVIVAAVFIWRDFNRPTRTYTVERRIVPISALDLSEAETENIMTQIFGSLNAAEVTIERAAVQNPATINGITWAASNVAAPGTFATHPENFGMHFQWNRRKGWSTADIDVENWNSVAERGTMWYAKNNPCPEGWTVPTWEEFELLLEAGSVWASVNGVPGRLFGDAPNQVFLPAATWRLYSSGRLDVDNPIRQGFYWAFEPFVNLNVSSFAVVGAAFHLNASGYSVRCVKIPPPPPLPPGLLESLLEMEQSLSMPSVEIIED
jgi:hypothetical protein